MTKKRFKKYFTDFLIIVLGTTIVTFSLKYILDPAGLVTGGVSGLAIVIRYLSSTYGPFEIPLWVSNVVLNVPIFLFAIYTDGRRRIIRTAVAWVIMSAELAFFPDFTFITDNLLLTSLYGGICFGVGTGLLLTAHATSGGTDMLGNTISKYLRHISVGRLIEILDGIVVICGAVVFNMEHTLYAIISVFVMGRVTDYMVDRGKKAKIALIISKHPDEISERILSTMDRGVTSVPGIGEYSKEAKKVLVCVCTKRDIPEMKDIVKEIDSKAFFVVGNINEAMGEGFVERWW
ncbi:MAG: YitT family protein [Lachnospiraceae bacterium]|nr:YitT family protein [Lachnospiraceae bacterium]